MIARGGASPPVGALTQLGVYMAVQRYTVEFLKEQIISHGGQCYLIADEIGCSHVTVYNYLERYPELKAIWNEARRDRWQQKGKNKGELKDIRARSSVYFIQCGDCNGFVKIGTSYNPRKRWEHYQVGCPYVLKFIGIMYGSKQLEAKLHEMFRDYNVRGEWFEPVPELIEFIETNTEPLGELATL